MRVFTWGLVLSALLLSGCSVFSKKTGNEPLKLENFSATATIVTHWSRNAGAGQGDGFTRLSPFLEDDRLYTVDHKGRVTALEREKGRVLWTQQLKFPVSGGIASEKGLLLLASAAGEVVVLSSENGQLIWRKQIEGEILSSPRTNGDVVAVQAINGRIYVLDAKTGDEKWFYENTPPVLTLRGTPSPIVTDNAIYAGFSNGRLMAFNPDNGSILWEQRVAIPQGRSELERMVDIHSTPILRDGILYVSTYQGKLSALGRGSGNAIWSQDSSSSQPIAVTADAVYVSQADGRVVAYNAANGEVRWQHELLLRRELSGPQVIGDYVAVTDYKGYLHLLSRDTGELAARKRLGRKPIQADMLTHDGTLYVYTNKGKLYSLGARPKS